MRLTVLLPEFEAPVPPTWGERIATFFGKKKRKRDDDPEEENLRLPTPKYLPKIVYAKRPQTDDGHIAAPETEDRHVDKVPRLESSNKDAEQPPKGKPEDKADEVHDGSSSFFESSEEDDSDHNAEMIDVQLQQTIDQSAAEVESLSSWADESDFSAHLGGISSKYASPDK